MDVKKLVSLEKSDATLISDEQAAGMFLRINTNLSLITEADRIAMASHFPGALATDVLYLACRFAFITRVRDTFRLPYDDEVVNVYTEIFLKSDTGLHGYN